MGYAFVGLHVGVGVANWIHDPRFQNVRVAGDGPANAYQSGDSGHVNGILTPLDAAIQEAKVAGASVLSYNPTSSPIADLTESVLSKIFFTGSLEREISTSLSGLTNITLQGFSQGGIIASNVALAMGLKDQRNVISQLNVVSTQISQVRVAISGAVGGGLSFGKETITYGAKSIFDFSNALGPDLRPHYFLGGTLGLTIMPVGIANHRAQ